MNEREQFEQEFSKQPHLSELSDSQKAAYFTLIDGDYASSYCQGAWEGWKARASQPAPPLKEREQFKLVPVEPTDEMIKAGWDVEELVTPHRMWEAMLEVAPSQPACNICNDTGRYCTGTSGSDEDGNAPIIEQCDCEAGQPAQEPVAFVSEASLQTLEAGRDAIAGAKSNLREHALFTTPPSEAARIAELEAKLAEWEKLKDSNTLHINLLRNFPAKLSKEQIIHLLGEHQAIADKG